MSAKTMRLPVFFVASFLLASSPNAAARESKTAELKLWVREAAAFVAAGAVANEGDFAGVDFPEYAESPEELPTSLYAGSAGVLVFLENAAAVLDDADLRQLADRTATGLLARAMRTQSGAPTWEKVARNNAQVGLYTGDAGVLAAFLARARLRGDASALEVARRIGDGIIERAIREGDSMRWDDNLDIISGAAGTVLALLELGSTTGDARYRDAALAAALHLARAGKVEGETRWWPAAIGGPRHYPNFSHGTSGIAYTLARVASATGSAECLTAAQAGAAWLLEHGDDDGKTLAVYHYTPGHEDSKMEGWCHGPTGTVRLFLLLAQMTGEERHAQAARKLGEWICQKRPAPGGDDSKSRFYSPSLCCGAAGVLDSFIDIYRHTGDKSARDYAHEVGSYLLKISKLQDGQRKWTNYDSADEKGLIYHGHSLMLGASGEALALLRLAVIDEDQDPTITLPDRATRASPITIAPPKSETPETPETPSPQSAAGLTTVVETPSIGHEGDAYIVLTTPRASDDPFREAARALAKWRKGKLIEDFDIANPEGVADALRQEKARHVALVLDPSQIDADTQRRFLMMAARLDDDIFVDVAYGYITGTSKTTPATMIARARKMAAEGLDLRWDSLSVASSIKSTIYPGAGDPTAKVVGYAGQHIYWGAIESDPDVNEFVAKHLPAVAKGGVVQFSGCGDPEGIWLFSDRRNLASDKHWDFDPDKIGHDPEGEMPRITADLIGKMKLDGSLVFSGVCHTGSIERVFVEGDIVSTFGRVKEVTPYRIPEGRSIAAAILDAGVAAYVAPIGPNHGYRNLMEAEEALERGLTLGDMMRSSYDDIAMAQGQPIKVGLYADSSGDHGPDRGTTAAMQGGVANRILYGDPALAPFTKLAAPAIAVTRAALDDGGFRITASLTRRNWWTWDMLADDDNHERIRVVVELDKSDPTRLRIHGSVKGAGDKALEAARLDAAIELIDGKRFLHLQIAAPRETGLGEEGASASFECRAAPVITDDQR